MKLKVHSINEIIPAAGDNLILDVGISNEQINNFLYKAWEYLGDDHFKNFFEAEGYKLERIKND